MIFTALLQRSPYSRYHIVANTEEPMNALLIIDMQEAYFKSPELVRQKPTLVRNIDAAIARARRASELILTIRTEHARDKSTWTLNMLQDDKGFAFVGSDETHAVEGLDADDAIDIIKTRDSAFYKTDLLRTLNAHGVTSLTLTGVSAHSCIFQTAADAYAHNFTVTLRADSIGDESEAAMRQAFDYLRREYRQTIT